MLRAVYRNGIIYPAEPVPPELLEGQEVRVDWEFAEPSDDPMDIDQWDAEWRLAGPLHFEPGEKERMEAVLAEADAAAKALVKREMESRS